MASSVATAVPPLTFNTHTNMCPALICTRNPDGSWQKTNRGTDRQKDQRHGNRPINGSSHHATPEPGKKKNSISCVWKPARHANSSFLSQADSFWAHDLRFCFRGHHTSLSLGPYKPGMHFLIFTRKLIFMYPKDKTVKTEDEKS